MKTLYIIACCLFLVAIASSLIGKRYHAVAIQVMNRSTGAESSLAVESFYKIYGLASKGHSFYLFGIEATVLGLGLWLVSFVIGRRKGQRLTQVLPIGLVIAYIMLTVIV